jgi:hypothetical protein
LDLIRELKQAKEDALWAKARLAEMIVMVNKTKEEGRGKGGLGGATFD